MRVKLSPWSLVFVMGRLNGWNQSRLARRIGGQVRFSGKDTFTENGRVYILPIASGWIPRSSRWGDNGQVWYDIRDFDVPEKFINGILREITVT